MHPASHCPKCSAPIRWHDNIPILSYLALRGKCRKCGSRISRRYVMVEFLSGLIWVAAASTFGLTPLTAVSIYYFMVLLGVSMTDVETGYIPDKFTLPSIAVGLAASAFVPGLHAQTDWLQGLFQSLLGVIVGGGILLGTGILGNLIFKKESMGGGDIKLLAMMGAFLGASKILLVFLFAPVVAMPMALYVRYIKRQETIVYGPFLAITGAWMFLYGEELWKKLFVLS